ncbi:MAG: hypothetical protein HYT80_11540 [Euryarchaeota archaeon]|nr:hypothetical protein [Euryarchaeota archaeon]
MDVLDAGVYLYKFVAPVPKSIKVVLWGPLQAKELGLGDWSYQDGGETGFIYHSEARAVKLGSAAASLIVVRRLGRAYLTLYLAGYPSDAAREQRLIDVRGFVTEAELFLTRLAGETVKFELADEKAVVDHSQAANDEPPAKAPGARNVGRLIRSPSRGVSFEV